MQILFNGVGFYTRGGGAIGSVWPWHDVILALEGRLKIHSGAKTFELGEGDALVIPPNNPFHGGAESETASIWVFHFKDYPAQKRSSPFRTARRPFLIRNACRIRGHRMVVDEFARAWKAKKTPADERALLLLGESILVRLEDALFHPKEAEPAHLRAAIDETLNGNLGHGVSRMARAAGVCPSHFRHAFRKHYGISPVKFLQRTRMEEARRLLSETSRPIKEIGQVVGYGELAAFHRAFRREVQMTPAVYRKLHGGVV